MVKFGPGRHGLRGSTFERLPGNSAAQVLARALIDLAEGPEMFAEIAEKDFLLKNGQRVLCLYGDRTHLYMGDDDSLDGNRLGETDRGR